MRIKLFLKRKKGTIIVVGKNSKMKGTGKYVPKRKSIGPKGNMTKYKHNKVNSNQTNLECLFL